MNKQRRKSINEIITRLESLQSDLSEICCDLENIKDEETDYFDNILENLQYSEKHEISENALSNLEDALSELSCFDFESIIGYLSSATE